MIRELAKKEGITIFLCTHQLRYAQELCTRYGLIEEGNLLAAGTLEQLQGKNLRWRQTPNPGWQSSKRTGFTDDR